MNPTKIKLVYFSPTGTTKTVLENIAQGIGLKLTEIVNITQPATRQNPLDAANNELLIVGVPVYMGRIPAFVANWLHGIRAENTPAIGVVVYGNRAYENSLLELTDILSKCGCKIMAGAAFIGEHSFSSADLPSSVGRPDLADRELAETFGRRIKNMLQVSSSINEFSGLEIPGERPYGGVTNLWHIDFIEVNNQCDQCGICAANCPTGAIDFENSSIINKEKCTLCCACIKQCPKRAKSMKLGLMKDAAIRCTSFVNRREPEFFFISQLRPSEM